MSSDIRRGPYGLRAIALYRSELSKIPAECTACVTYARVGESSGPFLVRVVAHELYLADALKDNLHEMPEAMEWLAGLVSAATGYEIIIQGEKP